MTNVYRMPGEADVYEEPAPVPTVSVAPFSKVKLVECPECGNDRWGPSSDYGPKVCDGVGRFGIRRTGCPKGVRHFHFNCRCGARWLMATKSAKPGDYEAQR